MKTISDQEAKQDFSRVLDATAAGEEFIITQEGKPVARMAPISKSLSLKEREATIKRMVARMQRGIPIGYVPVNREELHER